MAMTGGFILRIHLRFDNHPPEQLAIGQTFHQTATDQLRPHLLSRRGKERKGNRMQADDRPTTQSQGGDDPTGTPP